MQDRNRRKIHTGRNGSSGIISNKVPQFKQYYVNDCIINFCNMNFCMHNILEIILEIIIIYFLIVPKAEKILNLETNI